MSRPVTRRTSDRWMTPAVVIMLILAGTLVCLGVLASVTYLTARGFDAQPVVQLAGTLVAAVTGTGAYINTLVQRRTATKVERNTGVLGTYMADALDELDRTRGRHVTAPGIGAAPAAPGSVLGQDNGSTRDPTWQGPPDRPERYPDTPARELQDTAWFRQ